MLHVCTLLHGHLLTHPGGEHGSRPGCTTCSSKPDVPEPDVPDELADAEPPDGPNGGLHDALQPLPRAKPPAPHASDHQLPGNPTGARNCCLAPRTLVAQRTLVICLGSHHAVLNS